MKRKNIFIQFIAFTMILMVVSLSSTSFAAACLDVRDYGKHRYSHRTYYTDYYGPEWTEEYYVVINRKDSLNYLEQKVRMHYRRIYRDTDAECICGLRRREITREEIGLYSREEKLNSYLEIINGLMNYY